MLFQTCADMHTTYKVPLSPLMAQPRGLEGSTSHFDIVQELRDEMQQSLVWKV